MKHFKSILYVATQSADQEAAVARAVSLAENNQASLTVISIAPPLPENDRVDQSLQATARERIVAQRETQLHAMFARSPRKVEYKVTFGKGFLEIIREVLRNGHDLVIKQAEDPVWSGRLFGSDDMHLLRKCPCPLWLLRPEDKSNYESILAAVDFDPWETSSVDQPLNREIVELAGSLALSDFAALHFVHAWDAPAEMLLRTWADQSGESSIEYIESERVRHRAGMEALCRYLHEQVGDKAYEYLSPRIHLPQTPPNTGIPRTAAEVRADLVVMGTIGRTGIAGVLIGNTAENILDQLQCSVLALKPPGFTTPVRIDG